MHSLPCRRSVAFLLLPLGFIVGTQISLRLEHRIGVRSLMTAADLVAITGLGFAADGAVGHAGRQDHQLHSASTSAELVAASGNR